MFIFKEKGKAKAVITQARNLQNGCISTAAFRSWIWTEKPGQDTARLQSHMKECIFQHFPSPILGLDASLP